MSLAGGRKSFEAEEVVGGRQERRDSVGLREPGDIGVGEVVEVVDASGAKFGKKFEGGVGELADVDAGLETVGDGGAKDAY